MKLATNSNIPAIASRNAQLKQLRQFLTQAKNALMLVIGPAGIGKNNLSRQLVQLLNDEFILIQAKGHAEAKSADLAQWLARETSITLDTQMNSQQDLLSSVLVQLKQRPKKYLLIIENAQELPLATLAALSHLTTLQENSQIIMPVFLLGDESLIQRAQILQNNIIPKIVLNPLTKLEAFQYFHHCAQLHKSEAYQAPSDEEFETIYARSCGLPYIINEIAKEWVQEHRIETKNPSATKTGFWQQHGVKTISLFSLAVLAFYMHDFFNRSWSTAPIALTRPADLVVNNPAPMAVNTPPAPAPKPAAATPVTIQAASLPHFTLQLAALTNYAAATQFIAQHVLNNTKIDIKKVNNATWFVVDYGSFATKALAVSAENQLPKNLQHHAWVQTISA